MSDPYKIMESQKRHSVDAPPKKVSVDSTVKKDTDSPQIPVPATVAYPIKPSTAQTHPMPEYDKPS